MALDPNIALGVRQIELPNQLAQYAQLSQIQNVQNQNRMADMQLQEYERARGEEEGLRNYLTSTDFTKPENRIGLFKFGKTGREYVKTLAEQDAAALTAKNVQSQISERDYGVQDKKLKFAWNAVGSASTPQAAIAELTKGVKDGVFDMKSTTAEIQQLQNMNPEQYQQYRVQKVMGILDAKDKLGFMLPKIARQDTGAAITLIQDNPMLPGYGQPVAGMAAIPKTATFGERTAQGQLGLAQQKFAWEKANPGFELKEADDGSIVGVNKRTLQAFPVTVGGAAPAVAPMAGAGMPGARLPAAPVQAIPGMTSVLDQQASAAAPAGGQAGTPLMGKGTAMTETQSNAAMFGGAMAQAQNTIKQLEKSGTVKNAVVPSLLTGLAQMVPFGVGDGIGNVIQSTFNADPTGLIGPNAAQQKLAQAQLAFATAYLRKTSGAAFGASEISNTIKEFFPLIGEGDKVIAQKAAARERAIEGMKISTGREGRKYIEGYAGGGAPAAAGGGGIPNATPTNPLGLTVPGVTQ
jgi:hypothetical protein